MKLFEKRLARLESKKEALVKRAMDSTDADEVRSINEQIADLNAEIEEPATVSLQSVRALRGNGVPFV